MSKDQRTGELAGISEGDEVLVHPVGFPDIPERTRVVRVTPTGRMRVISGYAFGPGEIGYRTHAPNGITMGIRNSRIKPIEGPHLLDGLRDVDIARIKTWVNVCKQDRATDLCAAVLGIPVDEAVELNRQIAGYRATCRAAFPYRSSA